MMTEKLEKDHIEGWLSKWTNYIKGYQRRWFVLSNGLLSYYRSQAEMAHTCRGTINLAGAIIVTEDASNFMISNGGAQTFHLKASSKHERQQWIAALEVAQAKASRMVDTDDESSDDDLTAVDSPRNGEPHSLSVDVERGDLRSTLLTLASKLDDLTTCNDLITKHGTALQRALSDLDMSEDGSANQADSALLSSQIKTVKERAALFRITSAAMINASSDFLQLAQAQGKRWHKAIVHEREQRIRLQDTVETLAEQHNSLEQFIHEEAGSPRPGLKEEKEGDEVASDDEDDFVDAVDTDFTVEFVKGHKRNSSSYSSASSLTFAKNEPTEFVTTAVDPVSADGTVQSTSQVPGRQRRTTIPGKPNYSLNLWSVIKNCIGKDLSRIPMPVNFNEPLSFLQRLGEDIEYIEILNKASKCTNSQEQMAYVVAFSVTTYASTLYRTGKPFNPLLGETYEADRRDDLGFRLISEQVSHHPPAAALHIDSADVGPNSGWSYWTEITLTSKFRGKYFNVTPLGRVNVKFHASGNHYSWHKVTTTVNNIIVGNLWVDQSGDAEVINHKTGDYCKHKYFPYSYFSRETPRKVSGIVMDKYDKAHYIVYGTWDLHMDCAKIDSVNNASGSKPLYKTLPAKRLWQKSALPIGAEKIYFFSSLAVAWNEPEDGVAPTDSRLRPDQRMMENGNWDAANELKHALEDAQRKRRRQRETEAVSKRAAGLPVEPYKPLWFEPQPCEYTGEVSHVYNGKYWEHKDKQDWSTCVHIFDLPPTPALTSSES